MNKLVSSILYLVSSILYLVYVYTKYEIRNTRYDYGFALIVLFIGSILLSGKAFASDTTSPVSSITLSPASPDGLNGWYISPIDITIAADDLESGVQSINYKLDSGSLVTQNFNNNLNLVQNPSFEDAGLPLSLWDKTNDDSNATFSQDTISAPSLGTKSARIDALLGSWHGFNNLSNYAVATPLQNMTASVWIKTTNVTGSANFKVYTVYTTGSGTNTELISSSASVSGTTDWQKISLNFVANNTNTIGVYIDLGIEGAGSVWFDGVSISSALTQASVNFVVSSNGIHTLEYYSVDHAGNTETPHLTSNFKIDTKTPTRWTNFTLTQAGNDHTFIVSIKVTDSTSGLDVSTAEFQYSVDQGATWGYYPNLLNCGGGFIEGWKQGSTNPNIDGSKTVTLSTPAIDFCNSNWATTKKIRFRVTDMAGNIGQSSDFTINGSWMQVNDGDIHSNNSISMQANSTVKYLVGASSDINNISSTNLWFLEDYGKLPFDNYDTWYSRYLTTTPLPNGKLPLVSGKYRVNSDFTIASSTIPSGLSSTQNLSAVVFINGDLNINQNYSLHATSGIIFIVKGDITVASSVSAIDGFYLTDGLFDIGASSTQITISGGVQADEFNIKRSLNGNQNSNNPAEIFVYLPKYLVAGKAQLGSESKVTWLGVN